MTTGKSHDQPNSTPQSGVGDRPITSDARMLRAPIGAATRQLARPSAELIEVRCAIRRTWANTLLVPDPIRRRTALKPCHIPDRWEWAHPRHSAEAASVRGRRQERGQAPSALQTGVQSGPEVLGG